jgi:hypothetical protein
MVPRKMVYEIPRPRSCSASALRNNPQTRVMRPHNLSPAQRGKPQALQAVPLQPAPDTRAVVAIDVAELALEIGFLAGDYPVANNEDEGHQRQQQPEAVKGNG